MLAKAVAVRPRAPPVVVPGAHHLDLLVDIPLVAKIAANATTMTAVIVTVPGTAAARRMIGSVETATATSKTTTGSVKTTATATEMTDVMNRMNAIAKVTRRKPILVFPRSLFSIPSSPIMMRLIIWFPQTPHLARQRMNSTRLIDQPKFNQDIISSIHVRLSKSKTLAIGSQPTTLSVVIISIIFVSLVTRGSLFRNCISRESTRICFRCYAGNLYTIVFKSSCRFNPLFKN